MFLPVEPVDGFQLPGFGHLEGTWGHQYGWETRVTHVPEAAQFFRVRGASLQRSGDSVEGFEQVGCKPVPYGV